MIVPFLIGAAVAKVTTSNKSEVKKKPTTQDLENSGLNAPETVEDFEALGIPFLSYELEQDLGTEYGSLGRSISSNDVYNMVTDKLLKSIKENGALPWYNGRDENKGKGEFIEINQPMNPSSKKHYRGINALILNSRNEVVKKNIKGRVAKFVFPKPITDGKLCWLTFKQIEKLGGKLKKGSISSEAIYYNFAYSYKGKTITEEKFKELNTKFKCSTKDRDNENCKSLYKAAFLRYYNVFNEVDITGIDFDKYREDIKKRNQHLDNPSLQIAAAQSLYEHMPNSPRLIQKHIGKGESPYYSKDDDHIVMPLKKQYDNVAIWYGTLFHEMIHSTGHKNRLNRKSVYEFVDSYEIRAYEELIAEIGSAFLNAESGIFFHTLKKNTAYISGWVQHVEKVLQEDNKAIFKAAGAAQKAADYILDRDKNGTPKFYKDLKIENEPKAEVKKKPSTTPEAKKKPTAPARKKKQNEQLALFGPTGELAVATEKFEKMTVSELRKFILKYYNSELKGSQVAIKNSLQEVVFVSKAGRKIAFGGSMYKEKAAIVENLEQVIKNSTYNNFGPAKPKDNKDVLGYLNFKSKLTVDGVKRHVRISIILFKNRKTVLKNYDLGKNKSDLNSKGSKRLPSNGENKSLSGVKNTKNSTRSSKKNIKQLGTVTIDVSSPIPTAAANEGYAAAQELEQPQPAPVQLPTPIVDQKEVTPPKPVKSKKGVMSSNDIMNMSFDTLEFNEEWSELMQSPAKNMKIAIWGKPKNGKTAGATKFANYLTNFGNVLYNFADQGVNKSTKDLWVMSGLASKPNAFLSETRDIEELDRLCASGDFDFVFIDMINTFIHRTGIKYFEFEDQFLKKYPNISFILIFEVTKSGDFKGDQGWTHLPDALITVDSFVMENQGRYGVGHYVVWKEGLEKTNPKKFKEYFPEEYQLPSQLTIE